MSERNQGPRAAESASRTMTITPTPASDAGPSTANNPRSPPVGVLKLRGGPRRQRVMWTDETVDNEGMGRKKSKICCIYHKPKAFDESSSESDSSSEHEHGPSKERKESRRSKASGGADGKQKAKRADGGETIEDSSSESEGGAGDGRAKPAKPRRRHKHHECDHDGDAGHDHSHAPKANKYDVQKGSGKGKQ